jgi:hypothetical protein
MSVFSPFRNRRTITTALAVSGAIKFASHMEPLYAQQTQRVNIAQVNGVAPMPAICDNSTGILSTVINIGTTQAQVVAGSTQSIYVCGFTFTTADSSVLAKFVEGSSTDCLTSQADKTATFNLSSKSGISLPNAGYPQFKTSSGFSLCIDTTSTGIYGVLTYKSST